MPRTVNAATAQIRGFADLRRAPRSKAQAFGNHRRAPILDVAVADILKRSNSHSSGKKRPATKSGAFFWLLAYRDSGPKRPLNESPSTYN